MFSALKRLFRPGTSRAAFWERDPQEPLTYGTPSRPTPSHFAYYYTWNEALRSPGGSWTFDSSTIVALLREKQPSLDSSWFIWDRFVEYVRLECRLPFPHDRKEVQGKARIWRGFANDPCIEYEARFQIAAGWSRITMTVTPIPQ